MSMEQAHRAAQLLGVHWTSVYRLRKRYLENRVASSLMPRPPGPREGSSRLDPDVDRIIRSTFTKWLVRQKNLAHPLNDLTAEITRVCRKDGLPKPSRHTIARRWKQHSEEVSMKLANLPEAMIPPGHLISNTPLEIVQIDHTQADVFVVDDIHRKPIGRPWLSVAIDVATRCVVAIYLAMERPNAATVALLLTRVAFPKAPWIGSLGIDELVWPMHGIPQSLHLDNAAEFKSKALRTGCAEYGITLTYRPVGRPHFGGHIERMNRTLMDRLRGVPGSTGKSTKGRKERKPEKHAAMTLREFEQWMALEIAQRYHHNEHRGLMGASPDSVWRTLTAQTTIRVLPANIEQQKRFLIQFLPIVSRSIQQDGLTLFYIHYWHPIFAAWRVSRKKVVVRYHPEDLSRIYVSVNGKDYLEVYYADLRRPRISLADQREARRLLRAQRQSDVCEALIFRTLEQQRELISKAQTRTRAAKRKQGKIGKVLAPKVLRGDGKAGAPSDIDYSKPVIPYHAEIW
jgi:putative transposase